MARALSTEPPASGNALIAFSRVVAWLASTPKSASTVAASRLSTAAREAGSGEGDDSEGAGDLDHVATSVQAKKTLALKSGNAP
jgi:hypothetical protein